MAQQPLAKRRHQNRVGDLFVFEDVDESILVELIEQEKRAAEVEQAHRRAAPGVEVQRQRQKTPFPIVESLADRVVDRAQRVGFMVDDATFGKAGGSRRDHHDERIFAVDVDHRLAGG